MSKWRGALTIARRTSILAKAFAFALLMLLASEPAAAEAREPQSVLLASSKSIEPRFDAAARGRVMHSLATLQFGPAVTVISPEELDARLGPNLRETPASPENKLDEVEVETRALPGVQEQPLQSQIPFGLAAIAWGFTHPSDAWRLFLPVLSRTGRSPPDWSALTPQERQPVGGASNTAARLP